MPFQPLETHNVNGVVYSVNLEIKGEDVEKDFITNFRTKSLLTRNTKNN